MADPLSITASVTGLLSVAGKVCTIISGFISSVNDAPSSARAALAAVEEMRMVLISVRKVMDSLPRQPTDRKEMIHVKHLVVTFREAIHSFSELEAVVSPAGSSVDGRGFKWDRVKWVLQEERILQSVQRLEVHKNSLSTMLSILHCESDVEARRCFNRLEDMVRMVMDQNQALARRLEEHGLSFGGDDASIRFFDDDQSFTQARDPSSASPSLLPRILEESVSLEAAINSEISPREFEITLHRTRVYTRVQSNESDVSFASSAVRTNAWSMLSGVSLNDISVISVIALPISLEEINNIGPELTFAKIMSASTVFGPSDFEVARSMLEDQERGALRPKQEWRWFSGFSRQRQVVQRFPLKAGVTIPLKPGLPIPLKPGLTIPRIPSTRPKTSRMNKMTLYKLVVLGDGEVDKTALTIQLCLNHFVETYDPTIEDSYRKQFNIDGETCMLEVLDTAGQEEYTALQDQWIRDADGFLLVYSITSRSSFARISKFHHQVLSVKDRQASTYYTTPHSAVLPERPWSSRYPTPIMLVGNKIEHYINREVSSQEAQRLAKELGCGFVEASAKNCINVEKAFFDVVRMIRSQRRPSQRPRTR